MTTPAAGAARSPARPPAVLFADDDDAMRGVVRDVLESAGFDVLLAADGLEALDRLRVRPPDVIVTDLSMPEGGMAMVSRMRTAAPRVPIILLTAFGDDRVQEQARALGVALFLRKPVRMSDLTARIRLLAGGEGSPGR